MVFEYHLISTPVRRENHPAWTGRIGSGGTWMPSVHVPSFGIFQFRERREAIMDFRTTARYRVLKQFGLPTSAYDRSFGLHARRRRTRDSLRSIPKPGLLGTWMFPSKLRRG